MDSLSGAPLSESGRRQVQDLALQLVPHEPGAVWASEGQAEVQTADILSQKLKLKVKIAAGLGEIDFGLWQGLTVEEIKRRQPRLRKQWTDAPQSVRPPGGETLAEAQQRIAWTVAKLFKKTKPYPIVLVLPPIAMGLLQCQMEQAELSAIWDFVSEDADLKQYELDNRTLQTG